MSITVTANRPVNGKITERTYYEVVTVEDGVGVCQKESTAKILEQRGYRIVPDAPPKESKKPAKKKSTKKDKDKDE